MDDRVAVILATKYSKGLCEMQTDSMPSGRWAGNTAKASGLDGRIRQKVLQEVRSLLSGAAHFGMSEDGPYAVRHVEIPGGRDTNAIYAIRKEINDIVGPIVDKFAPDVTFECMPPSQEKPSSPIMMRVRLQGDGHMMNVDSIQRLSAFCGTKQSGLLAAFDEAFGVEAGRKIP